ncbi:hypothetical protein I4U23_004533 [Adineta vaga]|nr:hypothetical protein I4U23_004533 [Adineta vaga]
MNEDIIETGVNNGNDNGETFIFNSPYDQLRLHGRHWSLTNNECRAVVLIIHGSGEHCQRYTHVAHFFNNRQIAVVSFDLRGHGLSDGERGYTPNLDALFDDIKCIIDRIQTELYRNTPLVIYAHGTGSLLCLSHILLRPSRPLTCQAMIISTPSICLRRRPTSLLLFFSRAFANLNPHFRLPVHGNYSNVYCNDERVVQAYRNDSLIHDRWTAATTSILLELGVLLEQNIIYAPWPLLIQHGDADTITPINGIKKWVRKRVRGDVTFRIWPGHFHELHNDLGNEEILSHMTIWIEKKLKI